MTNSSLEKSFHECSAGRRLDFERESIYDAEYGLFYSKGRRQPVEVQPGSKSLPGLDWVRESFARMVVGEGSGRVLPRKAPSMTSLHGDRRIDIEAYPIDRYIEVCEEEYVFGGLADNLIGSADTPKPQRFINLIANRWLGSPINRHNVSVASVAAPLAQADEDQSPIQLLLPALPFKDQCAFRADAPADHVDLGEIAFLVRLHCLALAVNQMHRFDCECVIVSDGTVYAPMFGVDRADAVRYLDHLRNARDRLNLSKSVHIVDLGELVRRDDEHRRALNMPTHRTLRTRIRKQIETLIASDPDTAHAFRILALGMRWNINSRRFVQAGDVDLEDLWRWLRAESSSRIKTPPRFPEPLIRGAEEAAFAYAAFNLAINHTGLLARYFPNAVRLTTHAKPGQVMAPRIGGVFPWNGVGLSDALGVTEVKAGSIRSAELHTVLSRRLVPVYERNGKYPICYTEEGAI